MQVKFYLSIGVGDGQEEIVDLPDGVIIQLHWWWNRRWVLRMASMVFR